MSVDTRGGAIENGGSRRTIKPVVIDVKSARRGGRTLRLSALCPAGGVAPMPQREINDAFAPATNDPPTTSQRRALTLGAGQHNAGKARSEHRAA